MSNTAEWRFVSEENPFLQKRWRCNRCGKAGVGYYAIKTNYRIYHDWILCLCPKCFKEFPREYTAVVLMGEDT